MSTHAGVVVDLVIGTHRAAPAQPLVAIFTERSPVIIRICRTVGINIRRRLNIVDSAAVVVVFRAHDQAQTLVVSEALPQRCIHFAQITVALNRGYAQSAADGEGRLLACFFCYQVY